MLLGLHAHTLHQIFAYDLNREQTFIGVLRNKSERLQHLRTEITSDSRLLSWFARHRITGAEAQVLMCRAKLDNLGQHGEASLTDVLNSTRVYLLESKGDRAFLEQFIGKSSLFEAKMSDYFAEMRNEMDSVFVGDEDELDHEFDDEDDAGVGIGGAHGSEPSLELSQVVDATRRVKQLFSRLLSGEDLKLRELGSLRNTLRANPHELQNTLKLMEAFAKTIQTGVGLGQSSNGPARFSSAMELLELATHLPDIFNLFERFVLPGFVYSTDQDPLYELYMAELYPEETKLLGISFNQVEEMLLLLKRLTHQLDIGAIRLFKEITEAERFMDFVKRFKFYGDEGRENFTSTYGFVTNFLQGQSYDSNLLTDLKEAHDIISPMFDATSLSQVFEAVKKVASLDYSGSSRNPSDCLKHVSSKMDTIENWFEQKLENSLVSLAKSANEILQNGRYVISFSSKSSDANTLSLSREVPTLHIEYSGKNDLKTLY